jgi:glycosyltransferase involved in cell wall biosynthesis
MKILLTIHHHLDLNSGAPGTVLKLGKLYEALGHDVAYYSFDDLPSWASTEVIFPEFVAWHLLKRCQADHIDVIDASSGDAWLWGSVLKFLAKKRPLLVTRSHGLEHSVHFEYLEEVRLGHEAMSWKYPLYRGSIKLWEVAASFRCADQVFLLNQCERHYVIDALGVPQNRAFVTPNGIPDYLLNLPIEETVASEAGLGIAVIGTFISRKGIQYNVPALNTILMRHPHVRVCFLGTGCPAEKVLSGFDASIHDRVQVIPSFKHTELPQLLKAYQIKLFTPLSEGFGKALVEAMACGLAPITTAAAGPLDIVQDGYDAIVIPLRCSEAIETALDRLITNPDLVEKIRHNAYHTAQKYSWLHCAQIRLDLYKTALERRHG